MLASATVLQQPVTLFPATHNNFSSNPKLLFRSTSQKTPLFHLGSHRLLKRFNLSAVERDKTHEPEVSQADSETTLAEEKNVEEDVDLGWLPAFPHVALASMANFLFGYHIGVMNGPIVSIARELGFEGNSLLEGLVVSIFIVGAFIGSIGSGTLVDKLGCRRTFQLDTIPLILGAIIRRTFQLDTIPLILRPMILPYGWKLQIIIAIYVLVFTVLSPGACCAYICSGCIYWEHWLGTLVDKFGCRRSFQLDTIPLILGAIISARAHSVDEILLGRFLVGLGIGVNTVLVPIYISEVASTKYRGSLGTLCHIGTCIGIITSLFLGIPSENDPHWWRTILYIASAPGFILSIGMQFAVDSPRWLCKVGRLDEARDIVLKLWGSSQVNKAIEEFKSVAKEDDGESRWVELLEKPHSRVALIGGSLFALQQFAGINGVLYFSSLTFQDVGITSGALASLYVGLVNFAGALGALYLMDKQGRKKLLVGSYLGMALSMFLAVYAISSSVDEELSHNLSILGTLLYIFAFAVGAGPVTGLIIPEISSSRTRGKIMGFSFSVHWVCNFLVGLFFLELVEKFGVAPVYASFGGFSLLAAAFAYYFIVETKGRSLEEIEMSLNPDFSAKDQ